MGAREKQEKNLKPKGNLGFLGVGFSPRISPKNTREFGAQSWPKGQLQGNNKGGRTKLGRPGFGAKWWPDFGEILVTGL